MDYTINKIEYRSELIPPDLLIETFFADKAQQIFGGYGMAREYRVSWLKSYADLFFTGEGSANVQKILIAEDALGYKLADRHHGKTGLREVRKSDVVTELKTGNV